MIAMQNMASLTLTCEVDSPENIQSSSQGALCKSGTKNPRLVTRNSRNWDPGPS